MIGEILPAIVEAQEALHLVGRGRNRPIVGIEIDDLAQSPQRAIGIIQLLLVEERAPAQQRLLGLDLDGSTRLLVQELTQLDPLAPSLEGPLEEGRGLGIVGSGVVEPAIVGPGLGVAIEAKVEDFGGSPHDLEDRRRALQRAGQGLGQKHGHFAPAAQALRHAQHLIEVELLDGILLEDPPIPLESALVVLELLFVEPGDALGQGQALGGIVDLLQANLGDADQGRPILSARIHGLEQLRGGPAYRRILQQPLEHGDGARMIRIGAQHHPEMFDGPLGIAEPLGGDLGQPEA